jgi:hypothetical protein
MQGAGPRKRAGAAESGGGTESATRIAPLYGSDRAYSTKNSGGDGGPRRADPVSG